MSTTTEGDYTHSLCDLTPAEFETYLEDQTQRYLDMSASEFRERAETGTLPDTPMAAHLLVLSGVASR